MQKIERTLKPIGPFTLDHPGPWVDDYGQQYRVICTDRKRGTPTGKFPIVTLRRSADRAQEYVHSFDIDGQGEGGRSLLNAAWVTEGEPAPAVQTFDTAACSFEAKDFVRGTPAGVQENVPLTGRHVDYYVCPVLNPSRPGATPYVGECEDFIISLRLTYQEACVFKAIWRSAAARLGNGKPGATALYDAEKIAHYGRLIEKMARDELAVGTAAIGGNAP